jgi:hypothetical protein
MGRGVDERRLRLGREVEEPAARRVHNVDLAMAIRVVDEMHPIGA